MRGTAASDQAGTDQLTCLRAALSSRYKIERELGRGGMGTVYLAYDQKHDRAVAIKVLRPELAAALGTERFLHEIQTVARLTHPHILPLHDSGEAQGLLYYVMPYVEGEALRTRLEREKQLPLDDAVQIAREVADALSYAHGHNVLHRDIRPENILLESGHAVVADFGIARAITAAGGRRLTPTGIAVGSPAYMSPEQAAADEELDGRSDLYSLGCVVYEMLAGQPPFTGRTAESVVHQHWGAAVPSLTLLRPSVPAHVAAAVTRVLAKAPGDRFRTAAAFAEALGQREAANLSASLRQARRPGLRTLAAVIAIIGAVLALRLGRESSIPGRAPYPRTAIAVLPFENLSAVGADAYVAGGLHDELLTEISKVGALMVISRTSVMGYAGTKTPLRQIASELGVGSVVEGSVQVAEGRLRVHVELIDAATDATLWAESYDRTLDDVFAIQSDVAQQIVTAVGATLDAVQQQELAQAPTENAEAYLFYLQGRDYQRRPNYLREDEEIAQQLFERALALDPDFALAHAALADIHGAIYNERRDPSPARLARQVAEAQAALRLAPDLPQAHVAMSFVYFNRDRDYPRMLAEDRIALQHLPNDADIWDNIGLDQARMGHWDDAIGANQRAQELNPRDPNLFFIGPAITYVRLHRYEEAVNSLDRALSLAPDLYGAAFVKAYTLVLWKGRLDTMRAVLSRLPKDVNLFAQGPVAGVHLRLLLWERQPDSALQVLKAAHLGVFESYYIFYPGPLFSAWAQDLRGDGLAARAAFDSALVVLDSVIRGLPDDWRLHAARGLVLAGLHRRDEALREARWLQQSVGYRYDAVDRPSLAEERARILAQAGESQAALDEIERLLTGPSLLSVYTLRLDPLWEPLRSNPRFQALLAKYAVPRLVE